jgi:hypothetical protein
MGMGWLFRKEERRWSTRPDQDELGAAAAAALNYFPVIVV